MLIKKIALTNVRSFLNRTELVLDGHISIIIGPNGGGKTNLLDSLVITLRRYLIATPYAVPVPTPELPNRHEFRYNDILNNMILEKHSSGSDLDQLIELEIEATSIDINNMRSMKESYQKLTDLAIKKYHNIQLDLAKNWDLEQISEGKRFVFSFKNGNRLGGDPASESFVQYLQWFEVNGQLREEFDLAPLSTPLIYLPVNRAASGFKSDVKLAEYDYNETKRQSDGVSSRNSASISTVAVGRLAQKYRMLLEEDNCVASTAFMADQNLVELTKILKELGYEWSLETLNANKNHYDIRLKKQGTSFLVSSASSGEREILTYLFAIYALNVKDAIIIVDEPELHLHPKWQKTLLDLFIRLADSTGNQFILATHSPTFISPESIKFVSRVFTHNQISQITKLDTTLLPDVKHLLNIVNSQNNERIFFADEVILVEGISDRILFELILDIFGRGKSNQSIIEVVSVGGKGLFKSYEKILKASKITYSIIADLDYIEQVGTSEIKEMLTLNTKKIKRDVIDDITSLDGDSIVSAIETAISIGNWDHASSVWEYIKSTRRKLRKDLSTEEEVKLNNFLTLKKNEKIYILSKGSIEDYLPTGFQSKDIDKLINLINQPNFWEFLSPDAQIELSSIAKSLLSTS